MNLFWTIVAAITFIELLPLLIPIFLIGLTMAIPTGILIFVISWIANL